MNENLDYSAAGLMKQWPERFSGLEDAQQYEQFLMQDEAEEALFHITEAGEQADYAIGNDGSLTDLHKAIDQLVSGNGILR
jgi:predicted chitinase